MKTLISYIKESLSEKSIFVVIKPGFLNKTLDIIEQFEENGWTIKNTTIKKLLLTEAKLLYAIHKNESFYKDLCEYMSSEVTRAFIFIKPGVMDDSVFEETGKIKDKIREKFGESDMRNVIHSSDSVEHMEEEMSIYF